MEYSDAVTARKHVRAVFVTADASELHRWAEAITLEHSLDAHHAESVAEALAAIAAYRPDVAIAASSLGDGSYRDLLRSLHSSGAEVPVVLVGDLDRDAMREAFALGAIDVVPAADLGRIVPAVSRALREGVVGALLRRTRAAATLLEETLRRTSEDLAVVALDEHPATIVYATRPDLVGRPLSALPFARDAEEAEDLACAVELSGSVRLPVSDGTLIVEPFCAPPGKRRYAAISYERGMRTSEGDRDQLTGLPGRAAFELRARRALGDAERDASAVAVLFLDVDRFRAVNELGGHAAGDDVLRAIAERLSTAVPNAFVARFGGDEFVLLCREDAPGAARAGAEAAVAAFHEPFIVDEKPVYLTPSIGVASSPEDASDVGALIGTAEAAVFEAKRLGRNTVRWYAAGGATSTFERVLTRRDLQGAIERGEFELYYQPMYAVATQEIEGVEALIRWRHPRHGVVMPDRFIPIAEECGLIETLGAWVLETAVAQLRAWEDAGLSAVRVSVNVSPRQFESRALPRLVAELLERYGVAASSLEIEVTESAIMRDVGVAAALLGELRALGVRVSIDDFGTGYTSLGFLKRFPVDVLKIDRSFVADLAEGAFDGAVVRAVTTLARGLGVRTVAEGVEEREQFARLCELDCDVVQGFLFSRPLPAAACTPLLFTKLPA